MRQRRVRQAALFVGVSGTGWLLDTALFLLLSGPGRWPLMAANVASGSCGALLVFFASSRGIFRRNAGSMGQKVAVLLPFNAAVIVASSAVLAAMAPHLGAAAAWLGWPLPPDGVRLLAKVVVTPVTLLLNFVVVRLLLERFIGLGGPAPAGGGRR